MYSLLGEVREDDADDVAVVGGVSTEVGVADRLFDGTQGALVVGGDQDGASFGGLEGRQLLQGGGCTVVVCGEVCEESGVGASGTD